MKCLKLETRLVQPPYLQEKKYSLIHMRKCCIAILGALFVLLLATAAITGCGKKEAPEATGEKETSEVAGGRIPENLLQPSDLEYMGAFRLPCCEDSEEQSWAWGGTSMAYYPDGDPQSRDGYPGSIFGTGHDRYQFVSEISIPEPVISQSKDPNELNTAETLQEFTDIREGLFGELEIPRVGLAYLPAQGSQDQGKLYFAWGQHLQEEDSGPSHGWFNTDLSNPDRKGPWRIAERAKYVTTDYIFEIPAGWSQEYTPGLRLATGRFRDGGQGARGPSLIAFGPWNQGNPPGGNSALENIPLLLYSSVYDDPEGANALADYHHSDQWAGGAWLEKDNKSAVIFAGVKGKGNCWYGFQDGTVWPEEPPFPEPGTGERGWWSDYFQGEIIFYNPSELAQVASGEMEPYEPQPCAVLNINDFLYNPPEDETRALGAVSYDRERGFLYLFEHLGDAETGQPLVHVWTIQ